MTSRTDVKNGRNFDIDEGAGDEVAASVGHQALHMSRLVALQLRRTVVFVPLFGVVYLLIGFLWYQSAQAERMLEAESTSHLILLSQPAPQPDLLLKQIEGWDAAYQVTLDARISRPADSELIERVIGAAESAGLVVTKTGTNEDGIATLENDRYTVTPLLMKANGTLDGIERFLNTLETDEFAAFEVQTSMLNAEEVGYVLTVRGVFYSLPENYGDMLADDDPTVIQVGPVAGTVVDRVAP